MITNPNARLHISLDEDTNPTLDEKWLAPEEAQEIEAARRQCIEQKHICVRIINLARTGLTLIPGINQASHFTPVQREIMRKQLRSLLKEN